MHGGLKIYRGAASAVRHYVEADRSRADDYYQNLKDRELVPAPVMIHPDRWRLDQLLAWEERRMEMAEAALAALVAPDREPESIRDLLPQPKRRRRSA